MTAHYNANPIQVTIRQLPNVDAAAVLARMVIQDQIKQHKIRNGTLVEDDSAADMTTWARLSDLRQKKLAMMKLTDEETVEYKTLKKAYKQSKQEGQTAAAESHSTEVPVEVAQS